MKNRENLSLFKYFILCLITVFVFTLLSTDLFRVKDSLASELGLPCPGQLLTATKDFNPVVLRGLKIDQEDPFKFDFIVDTGDTGLNADNIKDSADKLIKYFMASLTVPIEDIWVNLSPYEQDRVISQDLSVTELGRDLLGQDYILKQLSSSLTHPDTELGKKYWKKNSHSGDLGKVWIVPEKAVVHYSDGVAFVAESYLKLQVPKDLGLDILLPELEREINTGKHFSALRQIYNSMILSTWYKRNLKNILTQSYVNKSKVNGIDSVDKQIKNKIYQLYTKAFKKGAYDCIRKQQRVKRRYFSGGFTGQPLEIALRSQKLSKQKLLSSALKSKQGEYYTVSSAMERTLEEDLAAKVIAENPDMNPTKLAEAFIKAAQKKLEQDNYQDQDVQQQIGELLKEFNREHKVVSGADIGLADNERITIADALVHFSKRYPDKLSDPEDVLAVVNNRSVIAYKNEFNNFKGDNLLVQDDGEDISVGKDGSFWIVYEYPHYKIDTRKPVVQSAFLTLGSLTVQSQKELAQELAVLAGTSEEKIKQYVKSQISSLGKEDFFKQMMLFFHKQYSFIPGGKHKDGSPFDMFSYLMHHSPSELGIMGVTVLALKELLSDPSIRQLAFNLIIVLFHNNEYLSNDQDSPYIKEYDLLLSLLMGFEEEKEKLRPIAIHSFMQARDFATLWEKQDKANLIGEVFRSSDDSELKRARLVKSLSRQKYSKYITYSELDNELFDFIFREMGMYAALTSDMVELNAFCESNDFMYEKPLPVKLFSIIEKGSSDTWKKFFFYINTVSDSEIAVRLMHCYLFSGHGSHHLESDDQELLDARGKAMLRLLKEKDWLLKNSISLESFKKADQDYAEQIQAILIDILYDDRRGDHRQAIEWLTFYKNGEDFEKIWIAIEQLTQTRTADVEFLAVVGDYAHTVLSLEGEEALTLKQRAKVREFLDKYFFNNNLVIDEELILLRIKLAGELDRNEVFSDLLNAFEENDYDSAQADLLQTLSMLSSEEAQQSLIKISTEIFFKKYEKDSALTKFLRIPVREQNKESKRVVFRELIGHAVEGELKDAFSHFLNLYMVSDPEGAVANLRSGVWSDVDLSAVYMFIRSRSMFGNPRPKYLVDKPVYDYIMSWLMFCFRNPNQITGLKMLDSTEEFLKRARTKILTVLTKELGLDNDQINGYHGSFAIELAYEFRKLLFSGRTDHKGKLSALLLLRPVVDVMSLDSEFSAVDTVFDALKEKDSIFYSLFEKEIRAYLNMLIGQGIFEGSNSLILDRFMSVFVKESENSGSGFVVEDKNIIVLEEFSLENILPIFYPDKLSIQSEEWFRDSFLKVLGALWAKTTLAHQQSSEPVPQGTLLLPAFRPEDGSSSAVEGVREKTDQERIIDQAIGLYFKDPELKKNVELIDWSRDDYELLDPWENKKGWREYGPLRKEGARIYVIDNLKDKVLELAEKAGVEITEEEVIHVGRIRGNVYLDAKTYKRIKGQDVKTRKAFAQAMYARIQNSEKTEIEMQGIAPLPAFQRGDEEFLEEFYKKHKFIDTNTLGLKDGEKISIEEMLKRFSAHNSEVLPDFESVLAIADDSGYVSFKGDDISGWKRLEVGADKHYWILYEYKRYTAAENLQIAQDVFISLGDLTPAEQERMQSEFDELGERLDETGVRRDRYDPQAAEKFIESKIEGGSKVDLVKKVILYFNKDFKNIPGHSSRYEDRDRFNAVKKVVQGLMKDEEVRKLIVTFVSSMYLSGSYKRKNGRSIDGAYVKEFELLLPFLIWEGELSVLPMAVHCFMEGNYRHTNDYVGYFIPSLFRSPDNRTMLEASVIKSFDMSKGTHFHDVDKVETEFIDFLVKEVASYVMLTMEDQSKESMPYSGGRMGSDYLPMYLKIISIISSLGPQAKLAFFKHVTEVGNKTIAERLLSCYISSQDAYLHYEKNEDVKNAFVDALLFSLKENDFYLHQISYHIIEFIKKNHNFRRDEIESTTLLLLEEETREDTYYLLEILKIYNSSTAQQLIVDKYLRPDSESFGSALSYMIHVADVSFFDSVWDSIEQSLIAEGFDERELKPIADYAVKMLSIEGEGGLTQTQRERIETFASKHVFIRDDLLDRFGTLGTSWILLAGELDAEDMLDKIKELRNKDNAPNSELLTGLSLMSSAEANSLTHRLAQELFAKDSKGANGLSKFLGSAERKKNQDIRRELFAEIIDASVDNELKDAFDAHLHSFIFSDPEGATEQLTAGRWENVDLSCIYLFKRGDNDQLLPAAEPVRDYFMSWIITVLQNSDVIPKLCLLENQGKFQERARGRLTGVLREEIGLTNKEISGDFGPHQMTDDFRRLMWSGSSHEDEKLSSLYLLKPIVDIMSLSGKIKPRDSLKSIFERLTEKDPAFYPLLEKEIKKYLSNLRQSTVLNGPNDLILDRFMSVFVEGDEPGKFVISDQNVQQLNSFLREHMLSAFYSDGVKQEDRHAFCHTFLRSLGALWAKTMRAREESETVSAQNVFLLPAFEPVKESSSAVEVGGIKMGALDQVLEGQADVDFESEYSDIDSISGLSLSIFHIELTNLELTVGISI